MKDASKGASETQADTDLCKDFELSKVDTFKLLFQQNIAAETDKRTAWSRVPSRHFRR